MRHPFALGAAAITVALLVAGCGSSSSTSSTTAASTTTPAAATPASTTAAATTAPGVVVITKHTSLGTVLAAGPKRRTVYLFEADKGPTSTCTGNCAQDWPPVTTTGAATIAGSAVAADLGTTTRSDGTKQVTYKGHPLYFFDEDKTAAATSGEGSKAFGADWYVLAPSGKKIDNDNGDSGDHGS
jgi:predicted lipoprotein with Yx(FWY)xxD motif